MPRNLSPQPAPEVSVVVPVFNESESLRELHAEIAAACGRLEPGTRRWGSRSYEIIYVDDGSSDGSAEVLEELTASDPNVTSIYFRRNFGKSSALAAGFARARGAIVITLDADLQDDPAFIPEFVERIHGGADLVCGWKQTRFDPLGKTVPSRLFNTVVRRLTGVPLHDINCGFKAYRMACVRELRVYGGLHRFLPVFALDRGFRIEEAVVRHRPRKFGVSKFGARRFIEGLFDLATVLLLTRYRMRPLHFFGLPGALVFFVGLALLMYLTVLWCLGHPVGTRPLLTLGVLLTTTGIQILCVGLVAEIIIRMTLGRRDVYGIRDVRHFERERPVGPRRLERAERDYAESTRE